MSLVFISLNAGCGLLKFLSPLSCCLQSENYFWKYFFHTFSFILAAAAKSLQSRPTLCDPIGGSPPGSAVPGILQARTLAWVAISFSSAWKWKVKVKSLSEAAPWTAAYQASLSMEFSRQEYWSGLPLPSLFILAILIQTLIMFSYFYHHNIFLIALW